MKALTILATLLLSLQVSAGGSQVGNAGNEIMLNQNDIKALELGLAKTDVVNSSGFAHVSYDGVTKLAVNETLLSGCRSDVTSLFTNCKEEAMVPTLAKPQRLDKSRISFKISDNVDGSDVEILTCSVTKIKSANDKKFQSMVVDDFEKTSQAKFPILLLACECHPSDLTAVGGDYCGLYPFDLSNGSVGSRLKEKSL